MFFEKFYCIQIFLLCIDIELHEKIIKLNELGYFYAVIYTQFEFGMMHFHGTYTVS